MNSSTFSFTRYLMLSLRDTARLIFVELISLTIQSVIKWILCFFNKILKEKLILFSQIKVLKQNGLLCIYIMYCLRK